MLPCLLLLALPGADQPATPDRLADAAVLAARVADLAAKHWDRHHVQPAAASSDAEFLRRVTLDLAGRIPTRHEATAFATDRSPDKSARTIRRLMDSPEYALHLGRVLDDLIQDRYAGDPEFVEYLRSSVAAHKPWDQIFREVLLGPWDTKERKRADRFLARRLASLDDLTNDTARVFFGVNVSCARCHDHPLAPDWTQDHYYGMASFFNRTTAPLLKGLGANIAEKSSGDVTFVTTRGERRTAKMMFLSGRVIDEPAPPPDADKKAPKFSRREQLVKVALDEKTFFSRALVNRLWAYFLGRGLVQPVDQMHSGNPPSIPEVLDALADDLVAHHYDLDRLVAAIVLSRPYQLASTWTGPGDSPGDKHFARARLRPLTPQQFALSLLLATGDGTFDQAEGEARGKRYRELEGQAAAWTKALDARSDRFQSSTTEALFMSNHPEVQRLAAPAGNNLAARLAAVADAGQAVDTAVWTVLGRAPEADERAELVKWLDGHRQDRAKACGEMVWALMTSAEFRFNH
jgi:hypothetical protein